jgi:hypothetical protein
MMRSALHIGPDQFCWSKNLANLVMNRVSNLDIQGKNISHTSRSEIHSVRLTARIRLAPKLLYRDRYLESWLHSEERTR